MTDSGQSHEETMSAISVALGFSILPYSSRPFNMLLTVVSQHIDAYHRTHTARRGSRSWALDFFDSHGEKFWPSNPDDQSGQPQHDVHKSEIIENLARLYRVTKEQSRISHDDALSRVVFPDDDDDSDFCISDDESEPASQNIPPPTEAECVEHILGLKVEKFFMEDLMKWVGAAAQGRKIHCPDPIRKQVLLALYKKDFFMGLGKAQKESIYNRILQRILRSIHIKQLEPEQKKRWDEKIERLTFNTIARGSIFFQNHPIPPTGSTPELDRGRRKSRTRPVMHPVFKYHFERRSEIWDKDAALKRPAPAGQHESPRKRHRHDSTQHGITVIGEEQRSDEDEFDSGFGRLEGESHMHGAVATRLSPRPNTTAGQHSTAPSRPSAPAKPLAGGGHLQGNAGERPTPQGSSDRPQPITTTSSSTAGQLVAGDKQPLPTAGILPRPPNTGHMQPQIGAGQERLQPITGVRQHMASIMPAQPSAGGNPQPTARISQVQPTTRVEQLPPNPRAGPAPLTTGDKQAPPSTGDKPGQPSIGDKQAQPSTSDRPAPPHAGNKQAQPNAGNQQPRPTDGHKQDQSKIGDRQPGPSREQPPKPRDTQPPPSSPMQPPPKHQDVQQSQRQPSQQPQRDASQPPQRATSQPVSAPNMIAETPRQTPRLTPRPQTAMTLVEDDTGFRELFTESPLPEQRPTPCPVKREESISSPSGLRPRAAPPPSTPTTPSAEPRMPTWVRLKVHMEGEDEDFDWTSNCVSELYRLSVDDFFAWFQEQRQLDGDVSTLALHFPDCTAHTPVCEFQRGDPASFAAAKLRINQEITREERRRRRGLAAFKVYLTEWPQLVL